MKSHRKLRKQAKSELAELKLTLKRARKRGAESETISAAARLGEDLKKALKGKDEAALAETLSRLSELQEKELKSHRPNAAWETAKAIVIAVLIALFIRWMFIETFRIPSGSMIPTLLIGDQLVVNKFSFGPSIWVPYLDPGPEDWELCPDPEAAGLPPRLTRPCLLMKGSPRFQFNLFDREVLLLSRKLWLRRLPERGEVVVFMYPRDPRDAAAPKENYIKRVVGLPGDKVELRSGVLYINDQAAAQRYLESYRENTGSDFRPEYDLFEETIKENLAPHYILRRHYQIPENWGPYTVPEDMVLMMGDNRDSSSDSRAWGFVPVSHLKGAAMFIHLPLNPDNHYLPRWGRFFKKIE